MEFTDIIIDETIKSELIVQTYSSRLTIVYVITTNGRRFLFDRGLLSSN